MSTTSSEDEYPDEFTRLVIGEGDGTMFDIVTPFEYPPNGIMLCEKVYEDDWGFDTHKLINAAIDKYFPDHTNVKPVIDIPPQPPGTFREHWERDELEGLMHDIFQADDPNGECILFLFHVSDNYIDYSLALVNTFKLSELGISKANMVEKLRDLTFHNPDQLNERDEQSDCNDEAPDDDIESNEIDFNTLTQDENELLSVSDSKADVYQYFALYLNTKLHALKADIKTCTALAMAAHPRLGGNSPLYELSDVLAEVAKHL